MNKGVKITINLLAAFAVLWLIGVTVSWAAGLGSVLGPAVVSIALVAVVAGIAYETRGWWRRFLILPVILVALAAPAGALAGNNNGGINWGWQNDNPFYHTNGWVNLWKKSDNPDSSTAAKTHLFVQCFWGRDGDIDKCEKNAYANDLGPWSDYKGVVDSSNNIYGCTINGHFQKNGCYKGYRKFHTVIDYPFPGFPPYHCYEWVKVTFEANTSSGDVRDWDWGSDGPIYC
jgi:hypothetical protein